MSHPSLPVNSLGCFGCSGTIGHNLGCIALKGTLKSQAEEYVSSLRRSLRFVLDGLVPVVGAKTTRPLLEIVVAYLHDSTGLIAMIEKAHQAWKNPAVTESLVARSREHHAAIQAAVAACRERLQNRQRALLPFSQVSVLRVSCFCFSIFISFMCFQPYLACIRILNNAPFFLSELYIRPMYTIID